MGGGGAMDQDVTHALVQIHDRIVAPLGLINSLVVVDTDEQKGALLLAFFEDFDVSDVEQIKRP